MMLLVRPFFMGFCLWLVAWMGATAALAVKVSCEDWNTKAFFERADVADVSRCLKAGVNVNARTENGLTPLHRAAKTSKTPGVVTALVKAGADVNARDILGKTPLHWAAWWSKTPAIVKALLDAGSDPAARDNADKIPWAYIKADSPLKGTDAYWRLNEGRSSSKIGRRQERLEQIKKKDLCSTPPIVTYTLIEFLIDGNSQAGSTRGLRGEGVGETARRAGPHLHDTKPS